MALNSECKKLSWVADRKAIKQKGRLGELNKILLNNGLSRCYSVFFQTIKNALSMQLDEVENLIKIKSEARAMNFFCVLRQERFINSWERNFSVNQLLPANITTAFV